MQAALTSHGPLCTRWVRQLPNCRCLWGCCGAASLGGLGMTRMHADFSGVGHQLSQALWATILPVWLSNLSGVSLYLRRAFVAGHMQAMGSRHFAVTWAWSEPLSKGAAVPLLTTQVLLPMHHRLCTGRGQSGDHLAAKSKCDTKQRQQHCLQRNAAADGDCHCGEDLPGAWPQPAGAKLRLRTCRPPSCLLMSCTALQLPAACCTVPRCQIISILSW